VYISNYRARNKAVFLFFLSFLFLCIGRLFYIQFFRSAYLATIARKQHNLFVELEPLRGTIFDCNLKPQAINLPADSLFASPNELSDKEKEAIILKVSPLLDLNPAYVRDRLSRKKSFIWIARKVTPQQADQIKKLKLKGLGLIRESRRSYPNGFMESQVLGFAGLDNSGLEGLEMYYDRYLRGEPGWAVYLRDARQKKLDLWEKMVLPKDGLDLVLTIDEVIQFIAERELDKAYQTYRARAATIIVMDPYTGAILALANRPTFDPNHANRATKDEIRNRAVCDLFEPGSVFKIVTAAAALEENKVSEEDRFFCENGSYRVGPHILHDHQPHGWLTFRQVIEESSNIGTTKVAQILGPDALYHYIKLFGFGQKTGVDLPGEISGMAKEPRFWSKVSIGAIPIGQEVGVTSMQLASAVSAIANGGEYVRPYIVQEIRDKHGTVIREFIPEPGRKVISAQTADRARKILTGVIEEGTGKSAKVKGFTAAGKTGTAQKVEPNGTYSHSKFVASFIGFAPAEEPLVAIVVCVDEPRPYYFGGVVAAPVFKNVAGDTIRYLKAKLPTAERVALNEDKRAR